MLTRGHYPLVEANLSVSPLLVLQFSKPSNPKGPFPLTLPHPPFIILSFSPFQPHLEWWVAFCTATSSNHPSDLYPLPPSCCLHYPTTPHPWTLSKGSKSSLNKMTTPQLFATFSSISSTPGDLSGNFLFSWFSWSFSLHLQMNLPISVSSECGRDHVLFDLFVLSYVLSIGKSIQSQGFSFQGFEDYSQLFISRRVISTVHTPHFQLSMLCFSRDRWETSTSINLLLRPALHRGSPFL